MNMSLGHWEGSGGALGLVCLPVMSRHFAWQAWHLVIHLRFTWQAWHLATSTFVLSHTIFVTHTHTLTTPTLSHTIFHTPSFTHQLCLTESFTTPSFTHHFVTHHLSPHHLSHTPLSHTFFPTQLCHTLSFTHNFHTHHLSHTTLSHTHTPSFFVTHHLSHTTLSHTTLFYFSILHHLPCLSFLPRPRYNIWWLLLEEVVLWGYPVL